MSTVPNITLNTGNTIPQLGYGTFQISVEDTATAVGTALEIGYRHIDTAEMYGNEKGVGEGVARSGIPRSEVFITSKLNNGFHLPDDARRAFDDTLAALGTEYVDLFLIHWPLPTLYDGDYVSTWNTLVEFAAQGRAKSVGVSNFQVSHLERLARETDLLPAVNQVEVHPYFHNSEVTDYCAANDIAIEAWAPIAQGKVLDDPSIVGVAEKNSKSPAQVTLRWHIQRGHIVFPKSVTPARMAENFDIFDFELSDDDMTTIDGLDRGADGRSGPDPDTFDRA
ncbi:aldo/keto reductase [Gordonia jinhuaensis]|uniref:Oxidoreductase n=1 Tax=Gordonia jinhuaensis TaxID=1517702 RepID=A0A916TGC5_9ACTN|nr:aldo/keto reductase [Gordonia jinhuaensis]GGB43794.1 oxidoreductase [Gordonia jinhuaensis]